MKSFDITVEDIFNCRNYCCDCGYFEDGRFTSFVPNLRFCKKMGSHVSASDKVCLYFISCFQFHAVKGDKLSQQQKKMLISMVRSLDLNTDQLYQNMGLQIKPDYEMANESKSPQFDNLVLCIEKEQIIGYCHWKLDEYVDCCYISSLYVEKHRRNKGIGGKLLDLALIDCEKEHPKKTVCIGVVANNYVANKLYRSRGFDLVCHMSLIKKGK